MSLCTENNSGTFETILINLANCHRKLKEFDEAIELYERCLTISPKNGNTYLALGYACHLKGEVQEALQYYHKAEFLKADENLVSDLIERALNDMTDLPLEETYLRGDDL